MMAMGMAMPTSMAMAARMVMAASARWLCSEKHTKTINVSP